MGIFKKKQPKGKNEIENKVLKENIVNAALAQFFYFAVQGANLLRLTITEELFSTIYREFYYYYYIQRYGYCVILMYNRHR